MSLEVKVLADAQVELYRKISRTVENLRKLGSTKITLRAVESRLQSLESNWAKFDAQDDKLFAHREVLVGHDYYKLDVPALTEEAYLNQKATLLDWKHSSKAKEVETSAATLGTPSSAPRTTLPRIQLPTFSGKYED